MAEAMEIDENSGDENSNSKIVDSVSMMQSFLSPKQQKRLDFLLEQAEVFSHFVGNSPKQAAKRNKMARKREQKSSSRHHENDKSMDGDDDAEDEGKATGVRFETTPAYINGVMRDYQLRGLNWLISLHENNVNGILADEMGLGKTLQTISILGFLKNYKTIDGPFLVVGPKSTLANWFKEVKKFCPTLRALTLIGEKTARQDVIHQLEKRKSWDVLLTTYEMILAEKSALKRYNWRYLVVDEAHRLKNENNKISTILRSFKSDNRLLLTGTPLQNNLHELWALLNFLLPEVFASADDFDTWFDADDCLRGNHSIVQRLRTILQPFMLRRIKAEVEKSLLPKIETKLFVRLTPLQHKVYKTVLLKEVKKINAFGEESTKAINMIVQELRKAANHPYLIDNIEPGPPYTTDMHLVTSCGKMLILDKLLAKLKSQGSRVVMFSQFTMLLDILEDYLGWRGYEYRRLDGQTPYEEREESIDQFNAENSDIFVFIISTRAGGLGINLATADTVIIYDSDWNPQSDFQAIDRVHRIGQKKQVRVYRLVSENTIDQRITERAEIKHRLDKMIIHGKTTEKNLTELTKGNKRDMIFFGAEYILSSDGSDVIDIDIDIDKVLKEAESKTAEEDEKYAKLGESELRNLTLEEASSVSVYQFEGVDFRAMQNKTKDDGAHLLRQRKPVQYVLPMQAPSTVLRKMKFLLDYQFYPKALHDMSEDHDGWVDMNVDKELKQELVAEGFPNWKRQDLKTFIYAMRKYGREDMQQIASMLPEKTLDEITRYHRAFWSRGKAELKEFDRYIASLAKAEAEQNKQKTVSEAFHWKMTGYRCPELELTFKGLSVKSMFTYEQDKFILSYLFEIGIDAPNAYARIREKISSSRRHNFDFFLRSRTAAELQRRAEYLLNTINREYIEFMTKNTSASSDTSETAGNKSVGGVKKPVLQNKMNMNMTVG
ncbi:chromatin-remodeling complex ATPase chain Iswi-like [Sitodiplosis mosellana]|uniref:chromatin-remodeling complex ATPase chain Iswi-like n=1 Tax=Sitodiplosis mosellana TaxID=263140 RepID=UPI0024444F9B|nr:chromatin-remodeling complex ATPase chain Iswi-like [Sitodiplosis mosellana]